MAVQGLLLTVKTYFQFSEFIMTSFMECLREHSSNKPMVQCEHSPFITQIMPPYQLVKYCFIYMTLCGASVDMFEVARLTLGAPL